MKIPLSFALGVLLCVSNAHAQTNNPLAQNLPATKPADPNELKSAQDLLSVDSLWNRRLDWEENEATLADVAAHLRKMLGDECPTVEVRAKDEIHSTFQLKKARIGPTLSSLAALANAQLWAFPGRLVIAHENALTPTEKERVKQKLGGEWKDRNTKWNSSRSLAKATLAAVGDEIKERAVAKNTTTPLGPLPYKVLLSDLSPTTQKLLQDLLNSRPLLDGIPRSELHNLPTLTPSTTVSFEDTDMQTVLFLLKRRPKATTEEDVEELGRWYVQKPFPLWSPPAQ